MEKTRLFVRFRRSTTWALQMSKSWRKRRSDQCTTNRAWPRGLKTSNNCHTRYHRFEMTSPSRTQNAERSFSRLIENRGSSGRYWAASYCYNVDLRLDLLTLPTGRFRSESIRESLTF